MLNRRWGTGLNVGMAMLLSVILFGMSNLLAGRYYKRIDLTSARLYSLSEKTHTILSDLSRPLSIIVFYQPDHPLYEPIMSLLEEYKKGSSHIKVEKVDPHRDIAKAQQLAQEYSVDALNVVVFNSGDRSKYVVDEEIAEFDFTGYAQGVPPRMTAFKGEEAFSSAILSITQGHSPVVRFTVGHGEKSVEDTELTGISQALKQIRQDNMDVDTLTLLSQEKLDPEKIDCLIIAGPTRRFSEGEIKLLKDYLESGGNLLALLDPLSDSGIERVVIDWGIQVGSDVVVDPTQKLPFVSAANVFVANYSTHPIVQNLTGVATLFPLVRSVSLTDELPEGVEAVSLAYTSKEGWGESNPSDTRFVFDAETDLEGPVSVAVAASKGISQLVVVGDADFMTNSQIANVGNGDLFLNSIHWLVKQEKLISISPRVPETVSLNLTQSQMGHAFWQTVMLFPVLSLTVGGMVWFRRRK